MNGLVLSGQEQIVGHRQRTGQGQADAPTLRVALYSYGHTSYDPKVGWIRKDLDLTTDLDALYGKLFALTIRGGTEYVTRVCRDAVRDLDWSKDPQALKLIFVCGNEPASQDKVVSLKEAADFAISKGVIINPVFCGNPDHKDARDWKQFAALCGGRFAAINQNKGHVAVATPFDKQIAELGVKLNGTYVSYGKEGAKKAEAQMDATKLAKKQGDGVAAARAQAQNSGLYQGKNAGWDLVDRMKADPKLDVAKIPVTNCGGSQKTQAGRASRLRTANGRQASAAAKGDQLPGRQTANVHRRGNETRSPSRRRRLRRGHQ